MASYIPRVVVKFQDQLVLPYIDGAEKAFGEPERSLWDALIQQFPGITLKRLYTTLSEGEIKDLAAKAEANDRTYHAPNFLTFFAVDCPKGVQPGALAKAFNTWPPTSLDNAYDQGAPGPLPTVDPSDDKRSKRQHYLNPAPEGVDAKFSWSHVDPGGAGEGIGFVDMEQGWTLNHLDLRDVDGLPLVTELPGLNIAAKDHGTRTLGVVVAVDNDRGDVGIATHAADRVGVGIAARANARVISEYRPGFPPPVSPDPADAIKTAVAAMTAGDVLLLEVELVETEGQNWPIEGQDAVWHEIRQATALGIIVIEPAGNGSPGTINGALTFVGQDLADFADLRDRHVLDPNSGDFTDSGAIIVAAAHSDTAHAPMPFTNFGDRIDCYAWGENVHTLDTDSTTGTAVDQYTDDFDGTSSAAAIVAGVALDIQSVAVAQGLPRRTPTQLRNILRNAANGTPSNNPTTDWIKQMPDLRKILINEFGVVP